MSFPIIPKEEYLLRWKAVQRLMDEDSLDVLFAYSDDRFTYGNAYARYYANFPAAFEPVLILFTRTGNPILLTGPESDGYAAQVGVIDDIRVLEEFAHADEDYPFSVLMNLTDVLADVLPAPPRKVGITCPNLMDSNTSKVIRNAVGNAEVVDVDDAVSNLRKLKSDAEITMIRHAYQIAIKGMEAAVAAIAPGVTERQIAAEAEYAMRKMGSDGTGIDTIVASGPNTKHVLARATNRLVQENDVVIVTVAPRYEGYHGAIGRTILVGEPDPRILEILSSQEKAQETCSRAIVPGKRGADVERLARETMASVGYGQNFLYSGLHSIGMIEFEPPILGPSSTMHLAKNMVVSIDVPTFETPVGGCRTEDGYLVTDTGVEPLTADIARIIRK